MTIDEGIKYCLEVAEGYEIREKLGGELTRLIDCSQRATENRQLAEWLTKFKETKRLLKMAVEDLERLAAEQICFSGCDERCPFDCMGRCEEKHWKHLDEALKLIKEE